MRKEQKFDVGYHVITWDLVGQLERAFPCVRAAGFRWFEALLGDSLGDDFARRYLTLGPAGLPPSGSDIQLLHRLGLFARAQSDYGLRVASLFVDAEWINPTIWPFERDKIHAVAHFLKGCGARFLVCGGGPPDREAPHTREEYLSLARGLAEIGAYTRRLGIQTVFHPHIDCFIETREQLDQLMGVLDTKVVGLCIDPTHFTLHGDDPVDVVRTYIDHIHYVHLKDVKGDVRQLKGYDRYLAFCELGTGQIDLVSMVEVLLEHEWDGLAIVELDYSDTPDESCARNARFLTDKLGLQLTISQ